MSFNKFCLPLLGVALGALLLAGCGSGNDTTASTGSGTAGTTGSNAADFKVALLTLGKVSDSGWNALAYQGLQAVKSQLGATVDNEVTPAGNIKDSLRSYAQKGYQLIFGHGYEYNDPAIEVAKDFPNTIFVTSSGDKTAANVGAFRFYLEQGFYLEGIIAAKMSKTGVVGEVGDLTVPPIVSTFKAFDAGAKSVNPNIKIIKVSTDGTDVAAAKQATLAMIDQKADFVLHQADDAAQGVFDACKERHVFAFGANANQNDNPSGIVLGSAVIICDPAFVEVAKEVKNHTYKAGVALYGMDKGAIDFVFNPALVSQVPKDVQKLVQDTEQQIKDGKITVPKDNF